MNKSQLLLNLGKVLAVFPVIGSLALVFRNILPGQLYLFAFLNVIFFLNYFFSFSFQEIKQQILSLITESKLLISVCLIYILAILFSGFHNQLIIKEFVGVVTFLAVYFGYGIILNQYGFRILKDSFFKSYIVFLLIALIYIFIESFLQGISLFTYLHKIDYNVFALYVIIGLIIIGWRLLDKKINIIRLVSANILLLLFTYFIFITYSRRGIIVLLIIITLHVLYSLFQKGFRRNFLSFSIFYITIFLFSVFGLFLLNNNNLRTYLIAEYLSKDKNIEVNNFLYRYSSVLNKDLKKIEFFPQKSVLNKILVKQIKKRCDSTCNLDKQYKYINYLAMFGENKNDVEDHFEIAEMLPDSIFNSNRLINFPRFYNLSTSLNLFFTPIELFNTELFSNSSFAIDSCFAFKSIDSLKPSLIYGRIPICDSSEFELSFNVYGVNQDVDVFLRGYKDSLVNLKVICDTAIHQAEGLKRVYRYAISQVNKEFANLYIKFYSDTLIISDVAMNRFQRSKKLIYSPMVNINTHKRRDLIKGLVDKSNNQNSYVENINKYHDDLVDAYKFSGYKNVEILKSNTSSILFNSINNGKIQKRIPTFPGVSYYLSFKTNIDPNVLYYNYNRFPEVNPEFSKIQYTSTPHCKLLDNGLFLVHDTISVNKSSSLWSLLILGSNKKNNSCLIEDFKYGQLENNVDFVLDKRQISYARHFEAVKDLAKFNKRKDEKKDLEKLYGFSYVSKKKNFMDSRFQRWKFGLIYYSKLNTLSKIFGDKLSYLNVFPVVFYSEDFDILLETDYPHNPVISSFLYSGVLGGVVYILFFIQILYYLFNYRKNLSNLSLIILVSLLFSFFSGNSHFSIPLFAIVSMFPLMYKLSLRNKEIANE